MQKVVRDALVGFMATMAEASAEATKAGIEHARASEPTAYLGRAPTFNAEKVKAVRKMLAAGHGASAVAKATKLSRQAIFRVRTIRHGPKH